jgi:hypothetical protein
MVLVSSVTLSMTLNSVDIVALTLICVTTKLLKRELYRGQTEVLRRPISVWDLER